MKIIKSKLSNRKGFTLIELLVVIGVLAVIAAGVVALINPQDKLRQARDAKVQSDIGQLATALQSYAAQQPTGTYPTTVQGLDILRTSGELTSIPKDPTNTGYSYTNGASAVLYGPMTSQKSITAANLPTAQGGGGCAVAAGGTVYWKWSSTAATGANTCWQCNQNPNPCP